MADEIDMKPLKLSLSGLEIEGYSVQYRKTAAG